MTTPHALLIVILAAATGFAAAMDASIITIGASPSRFELEIGNRPVNEALKIFNYGSETARIQVSVNSWTLDERNEVQVTAPTEQALDQWMIISPMAFEVPPGSFQTVRFSIRPRVEPQPGEHRAMIYLQQQPTEGVVEGKTINIIGRVGIAVYAYVGEVERIGRLHDVEVHRDGELQLAYFDISSIGTAHVRLSGQYTIWPAELYATEDQAEGDELAGNELVLPEGALAVGWLPPNPVLPDARRRLAMRFGQDLPAGDYVFDVRGELGGEQLRMGVPFSISDATSEEIVSN